MHHFAQLPFLVVVIQNHLGKVGMASPSETLLGLTAGDHTGVKVWHAHMDFLQIDLGPKAWLKDLLHGGAHVAARAHVLKADLIQLFHCLEPLKKIVTAGEQVAF